jgi:hypothetical protein
VSIPIQKHRRSARSVNKSKFFQPLAVAVAGGESIKSAAGSVGCSSHTAYHLSSLVEFRKRVSEIRSEISQQAVGKLTLAASKAADTLVALLSESQEPSVRLNAAKAILASLLPISEFGELRARLDAIEAGQLRVAS